MRSYTKKFRKSSPLTVHDELDYPLAYEQGVCCNDAIRYVNHAAKLQSTCLSTTADLGTSYTRVGDYTYIRTVAESNRNGIPNPTPLDTLGTRQNI